VAVVAAIFATISWWLFVKHPVKQRLVNTTDLSVVCYNYYKIAVQLPMGQIRNRSQCQISGEYLCLGGNDRVKLPCWIILTPKDESNLVFLPSSDIFGTSFSFLFLSIEL
jgi:hypothetical protein